MGMAANPSGAHQAGRVFTGRIDEVACQRAALARGGTLPRAVQVDIVNDIAEAWHWLPRDRHREFINHQLWSALVYQTP